MYDEILWRDIEFVEVGSRGVPGSGPGFFFINKKIDAYNTLITRKAWSKSKQKIYTIGIYYLGIIAHTQPIPTTQKQNSSASAYLCYNSSPCFCSNLIREENLLNPLPTNPPIDHIQRCNGLVIRDHMSTPIQLHESEVTTRLNGTNGSRLVRAKLQVIEACFAKGLLAGPLEGLSPGLVAEPVADDYFELVTLKARGE